MLARRAHEPELIDGKGPEPIDKLPDVLNVSLQAAPHVFQLELRGAGVASHSFGWPQAVAMRQAGREIMQLAGDAPSFFLLRATWTIHA
jgi:hypothetical protein